MESGALSASAHSTSTDADLLIESVQELSRLQDLDGIIAVVRTRARELTGADGVTFVLREGDQVFYADENAIAPLWKGRRFPADACISGWTMIHRRRAAIEDIYADPRIPIAAYQPTFVKSLLMVPIRQDDPVGAIGAYWATRHRPTPREEQLLQALANSTAIAIANAELYREARAAVRTRDQFFAVAAHELRTPLTVLQLSCQAAERDLERGEPLEAVKKRIATASEMTQRLARLIDDMLDVSHMGGGARIDTTFQLAEVDLAAIAQTVAARFREPRLGRGSAITVDAPAAVVGRWDGSRLEQVVTNLLSNACKYGEGKPVAVRVAARDGSATLEVADQGIGVAPADAHRIFGPFERAVSVDHYGGLGFGLFIVRTLVEAFGGRVDLDSQPGRGARFIVELPLRRAQPG
jgi:signal transduction histidine kinase